MDLPPIQIEAAAPVASYHYHRNGQQEYNPGLGVILALPTGERVALTATALAYQDSHGQGASTAMLGVRAGWDVLGVELAAGYGQSSTYAGPVVIPSLYVGYDRVHVSASALGVRAIGFTVRVRIN